jgi:hypothetical protein
MLTSQDLINIIKMFFEFNNLDFENFKTELIKQTKEYEKIEMTFEEVFEYNFKRCFNYNKQYYVVFDAFLIWSQTAEGYDYWSDIDNKFKEEFEKYKKLYLNKMFED